MAERTLPASLNPNLKYKRMKKKLSLLAVLLVSTLCLMAQKGAIKGRVIAADGTPVAGAIINVLQTNYNTVADDDGRFQLSNLPPGNRLLQVDALGYADYRTQVTVPENAELTLDITLQQTSVELSDITVTAPAAVYAEKRSSTASRMPITNLENPQVYTVLPKELMRAQLISDYQSALNSAPGVSNVNYGPGSGGIGLWAYMRGFNVQTATIRNGLATNFVTLSDPYNTERLEVIKGPVGTLFGTTLVSYGGLINQETKKPLGVRRGELAYTVGSWGNNRLTADVNLPVSKMLSTRFNAFYQSENSFQDYGRNRSFGLAGSMKYQPSDRLTFFLDAEYYSTERNATFIGVSPMLKAKHFTDLGLDPHFSYTNNDLLSKIHNTNIFAKAIYKLSSHWESQTLLSTSNSSNEGRYVFLQMATLDSLNRIFNLIPSTFNAVDIQQNITGTFHLGSIKNRLLAGLDYVQNKSHSWHAELWPYDRIKKNAEPDYFSLQKLYSLMQDKYTFNNRKDWRTFSIYASDVINFTDNLSVLLALRADFYADKSGNYDYTQNKLSPKFGLVYQPVKDKVSVFANYMNGFKNISPQVIAGVETRFKPEEANQMEAGMKLELFNKRLSGTLSYYDVKVKDVLRINPEKPTESIQDGTRESRGVEMDVIANPVDGLELICGYGYNDSRYVKAAANIEGRRPASVPQHTANFWLSYKHPRGAMKGLGIGAGGNVQSEMGISDYSDIMIDGYCRLDATVFYEQEKYRVGLKVNNLTDKNYYLSDYWGQFQKPREVLFNVTYKF